MKKVILFLSLFVFLTDYSFAVSDPINQGMQLYKKHHYEDASNILLSALSSSAAQTDKINLSLGMVYLANSKLYYELYKISTYVHVDYLTKLIDADKKSESSFSKFYLGRALLESGKLDEGMGFFKKYLADKRTNPVNKDITKINIGIILFLQGSPKEANKYWSKLNVEDPLVLTTLAAAYSKLGLKEKPLDMCQKALDLPALKNQKLPTNIMNNILGVYARSGKTAEGFKLLKKNDLKAFFCEETVKKNKTIRFYDTELLKNISELNGKASLLYFENAANSSDPKIKSLAQFNLIEAYKLYENPNKSLKTVDAFLGSGNSSTGLANRAKVRKAIDYHLLGQKKDAVTQLDDILKQNGKPGLMTEILLSCSRHNLDYPQIVVNASTTVQKGDGRPIARLNFALGRYYLYKHNYSNAVKHMEAGRDKSNKNRIEHNDPQMLSIPVRSLLPYKEIF